MKALSLAKPLFILVIGLPGAGKSFFARHFSDTFGAPLISADELQFEIFDKPKFTPTEFGLVRRLLERQITQIVKTRTSILVDGICNTRQERQQLEQLAANNGYSTLIVWVQTDEPTAKIRSTTRNKKRPGDELNARLDAVQYVALAKRFAPPTRSEDYVVISGKHTYTTQAKMVLRKLSAPRAEKADQAHQKEAEQVRARTPATPARRVTPARRNVIIR
jgi:predicted kinase